MACRPVPTDLCPGHLGCCSTAPRSLIGSNVPFASRLGEIPDLHLRIGPQIDPAVGLGDGLVINPQLEVAIISIGGQVSPLPVIDHFTILDTPMSLSVCGIGLQLGLPFGVRHGGQFSRIKVLHAMPAAQIPAVKDSRKARGGSVVFLGGNGIQRDHPDQNGEGQ